MNFWQEWFGGEDKFYLRLSVIVILTFGVLYLLWGTFFGYDNCEDWQCFNEHLESCERVRFIGGEKMIFEYFVLGKSGGECRVNVRLLQADLNRQDSLKLEGESMICNFPLGVVLVPESDIGSCHGPLKEGLQELLIEKLYTYLVQNVGKINLDIFNNSLSA